MMICAHRGGSLEAPENTSGAFGRAMQQGFPAVELDVRLSRDRQCMVIHDPTVDRTTRATGRVCDYTARQLADMCAPGPFAHWPNPQGIPTLANVLGQLTQAKLILIEVKRDDPQLYPLICEQIGQLIDQHDLSRQAVVASFDVELVTCACRVLPTRLRALIGKDITERACELNCHWIMPQFASMNPQAVRDAQARGMKVACWTPNQPDEIRFTLDCCPDAIITDAPTLARDLLAARQATPAQ